MPMSLQAIDDLLRSLFPIGDARFELCLAPAEQPVFEDEAGLVWARVQLVTFEEGGERTPRDVKEQEMFLLRPEHRADEERVAAYFRAWAKALPALVDRCFKGDVEVLMPHDLFFPEALREPGARDVDGFLSLFSSDEALSGWLQRRAEEEVSSSLEYFGLGAHAKELHALFRPAIRLVVDADRYDEDEDDDDSDDDGDGDGDSDESDIPIGASKIGGLPDLPPGAAWPRIEGVALAFLAQVNLAEIARLPGAEDLPPTGLLAFFYDAGGETNRDEEGQFAWPVKHRGGARVLHLEGNPATFARAAAPPDRYHQVFPVFKIRYERERMMPPMESPFYEALDPNATHDNAWYSRFSNAAHLNEFDPERPIHRLLGYTSELQGDPYLSAHVDSIGQTFENWQRDGERERALQREATRWRLLLQVDSEPRNKLLNQDGGFFYFLIRDDDLAARRFDEVWGVLQCH